MHQNKQHGAALLRNVGPVSTFSRFRNVAVLSALMGAFNATGQVTLPKINIPNLKPLSSLMINLSKPAWAESATGEIPKPPKELTKEEMKTIALKAVKETMNGDYLNGTIGIASNVLSNRHIVQISGRANSSTLLFLTSDTTKMDSDGYVAVDIKGYELGFKLSNNPNNPPKIFVHGPGRPKPGEPELTPEQKAHSFYYTGIADAIVVLDYEGGNWAMLVRDGDGAYRGGANGGHFSLKKTVGTGCVNFTPSELKCGIGKIDASTLLIGLVPTLSTIPTDITLVYGVGTNNISSKDASLPAGELLIAARAK